MNLRIPICWGVLLLAFLAAAVPVQANISDPFTFINLPKNTKTANGDIGEDQLFVVVSDEYLDAVSFYPGQVVDPTDPPESLPVTEDDDHQIMFTFYNIGDEYCSIVDIYFYDGTIVKDSIGIYDASLGVEFTAGGSGQPINLPGTEYDKLIEAYTLADLADADEKQATIVNGIESVDYCTGGSKNEWLSIIFTLQDGMGYVDVRDAIINGDLLIGLRVHFDPDSGSPDGEEQFLTCFTPIPAPGAIMLGGIGVVFVGYLRRQRTL